MKREVLIQLVEQKIKEIHENDAIPADENGKKRYQLYDFCVEVIPEDERQSKHIDILELLLDWGYRLEWKNIKFQPIQREDSRIESKESKRKK